MTFHTGARTAITTGTPNQSWMRYSLAGSALVAGLFCILAVVLMVANHRLMARYDPLNDATRQQFGVMLHAEGGDAARQQVRKEDLVTRRQYFRAQSFAQWGGYILIAGAATLIVSLKLLMRADARPPALPSAQPVPAPQLARSAALARWSVGLMALLLGASALGLGLDQPDPVGARSGGWLGETWWRRRFGNSRNHRSGLRFAGRNGPQLAMLPRGPEATAWHGVTNIPTQWDGRTGQGILWKTPLPLPGNNSPIRWGNRLYLSGATDERREVYGFDADTRETAVDCRRAHPETRFRRADPNQR